MRGAFLLDFYTTRTVVQSRLGFCVRARARTRGLQSTYRVGPRLTAKSQTPQIVLVLLVHGIS